MLTILLLILVAMFLAPLVVRVLDTRAGWLLALAPLAGFLWFASQVPQIAAGAVLVETLYWVPTLDIQLSLRLDGLSLLFALLITGVGTLIVLYTSGYLEDHHHIGRFYIYLLAFMMAMLGLVLADDLIAMFVFWELTSVASFLLIGYLHNKPDARRSALQALLITGGGGLALLAGLLLLGTAGEAWRFSELFERGDLIAEHALYPAIFVLILLGCFTKSAQVPFHLWLPNAMAAPTPVSAYLHSATMVKAGIYLLARLNPVLGGSDGWGIVLVVVGATTALVGAVLAIRQMDLKRVLAYTTVTVLGQLTMLIGTNTAYGLQAFVVYLLAHAMYKGALFMAVGAIDHATGTRDINKLGGLIRYMPLTGFAVGLAAFSNAGIPPAFGFIAKEFKYAGLIEMGLTGWFVTAVMILTNALLLAAAGVVFIRTFLGRPGPYPKKPHEVSFAMWLGPAVLAILGFLFGAFNAWPEEWLVRGAVQAVARGEQDVNLYLWGGVTPALIASLLTVALGIYFYRHRHALRISLTQGGKHLPLDGDHLWDRLLKRTFELAGRLASAYQHGSLRLHALTLVMMIGLVALVAGLWSGLSLQVFNLSGFSWAGLFGCLIAALGAIGAAAMRDRLALVAALGVSGLGVALFFFAMQAPDVAITQIMAETLTVVFLALVLARLPALSPASSGSRRARRLRTAIASLFGLGITVLLLAVISAPLPGELAHWFLSESQPGGHGGNVVNVILVDFRALDTFGEIVVVALAGLAAVAVLGSGEPPHSGSHPTSRRPAHPASQHTPPGDLHTAAFHSPLLRQAVRPLAGLMILLSLVLLWRGHNLPGGGFIGGLVAATGFVLIALTFDADRARRVLRVPASILIGAGLLCAGGAGVLGLLAGAAFLDVQWIFPAGMHIGTVLLFDIGVFLTVVGAVLHVLFALMTRKEPGWS